MNASTSQSFESMKWIRWTARILSAISLCLILAFIFGEGFNPGKVVFKEWIGLLFFPFGMGVGLLIGWRYELLGGIISVGSLLGFYLIYGLLISGSIAQGWAFLFFAIPGFVFLLSGLLKK